MSVSDHITDALQGDIREALQSSIGFNDDIAKSLAASIARKIQSRWGGREIYIPVGVDVSDRNRMIKQEFNGSNHAEICRRHNISLSTLYRIIR
ncbi:MAG: Mor transcription activator family protein [Methylobacter sp.]